MNDQSLGSRLMTHMQSLSKRRILPIASLDRATHAQDSEQSQSCLSDSARPECDASMLTYAELLALNRQHRNCNLPSCEHELLSSQ